MIALTHIPNFIYIGFVSRRYNSIILLYIRISFAYSNDNYVSDKILISAKELSGVF